MLRYQRKKIIIGRRLSMVIPIVSAIILSFGNDFISWHFIEENDMVNVTSVKYSMFVSNIFLVMGLFLTILLSHIIFRQIIRQELINPLNKLTEAMSEVQKGNLEHQISYDDNDTLYEVYEAFNDMVIEFRRLTVQAQEQDKNRRELLLHISHDLRSPLTSIIGYVQGLIDNIPRTQASRDLYLETIKQKALDINGMVERLFLFAKLDYHQYEGSPEALPVNEVLASLLARYQEDYGQDYHLHLVTEGNAYIFADYNIFSSICTNLIENSYKYNDNPKGELTVKVKEESQYVRIRFIDNGPGIPEDILPNIWNVFYRSDPSRSNPCQGSGIGLAIVKKAVDHLNGKVISRNRKEKGLVTTVKLPKLSQKGVIL